ncbi:MAG: CAP domain-containing protein [Candidatus Aminicenantes bacterium]|jgi:uncharacterized protein YkwD
MIPVKRAAQLISIFFFVVALSPRGLVGAPQNIELPSGKEDLLSLEQKLFELINEERQKRNLHLLSFSQDLSQLARAHSEDMASRGRISHASTDGRSYQDRIVNEGYYFIALGENVAFSNGFQPGLIHEELMKSPGHRENILDPNFDEVGIGAVLKKDKGYFITQDFRRSPVLRDENEVKREIQRDMNTLRRKNFLVPLNFLPDADEYARRCSLNRIEGRRPPPLSRQFGDTLYHFITSPALEDIQSIYKDIILDETYETAGLGVVFSRNTKYPGGSYFITLLLFPENKYRNMSTKDIKLITIQNVNDLREREGYYSLIEDKQLEAHAKRIVKKIFPNTTLSPTILPELNETTFLVFVTEDPTQLSGDTKEQIKQKTSDYERIGIGILFGKNEKFRRGAFWVLLIFGK